MELRPAVLADAPACARLIAATMGEFEIAVFGLGNAQRMNAALESFCMHRSNRFSYELVTLVELDREIAGLLLSFPSSENLRLTTNMLRAMPSIYGVRDTIRLLARSAPTTGVRETEANESYIAHLATEPAFRRRGVAKFLLAEAESRARQTGLGKLSLMVEADNEAALMLYASCGFRIDKQYNLRYLNKGLHSCGINRMVKFLA